MEIVRKLSDAVKEALDSADPGAWFESEYVAEDYEWVLGPGLAIEKTVYRGREGFIEFFNNFTQDFEDWSGRAERFIDAGDDRVVIIYRQQATGKVSGAQVDWQMGQVSELEDGRVIRTWNYATPEEALEAAGLSE